MTTTTKMSGRDATGSVASANMMYPVDRALIVLTILAYGHSSRAQKARKASKGRRRRRTTLVYDPLNRQGPRLEAGSA